MATWGFTVVAATDERHRLRQEPGVQLWFTHEWMAGICEKGEHRGT